MTYKVADGHDNEAGYVTLSPQPAAPRGTRYPDIYYSGVGAALPKGKRSLTLVWNSLDNATRASVRSQLGLTDTVLTNEATMYLPSNDGQTWGDYNVIINDDQDFTRDSATSFGSMSVTVIIQGET